MFRNAFAMLSLVTGMMASTAVTHAATATPPDAPDIVMIGDSQAQGVGGALQRLYMRKKEFHVIDKTKVGTGLTSRSTYDWEAVTAQLPVVEKPTVAIVMFGANDRPPIRIKGLVDQTLSDKFTKSYGARVANIVQSLRKAKMDVVWLGDPVVENADYLADMDYLNKVMEPVAETGGAKWVSLWDITGGDAGTYAAYGKALDGQTKRLRADDGVHFTPTGYDLVAARLDPILKDMTAGKAMPAQPAPPVPAAAMPAVGGPAPPAKSAIDTPQANPSANVAVTQ